MKSQKWSSCIITAFDVIGTQGKAPSGLASKKLIEIHKFAVEIINSDLPNHSHGYVWNDSILLLSYLAKPSSARSLVLQELSRFKQTLEAQCAVGTYAISVMGLAFPQGAISPRRNEHLTTEPRAVLLKTSSWAMANCFRIEKALKRFKADWYIDSRITKGVVLPKPMASEDVHLLPKEAKRTVLMYSGYLHQTDKTGQMGKMSEISL